MIAVHRNGERVAGKIGDIVLRPGDTLLLQTAPGFLRVHRNSPDFYLVSELPGTENPRYDRAWVALGRARRALIAIVTLELAADLGRGVPGRGRAGRHALHHARRRRAAASSGRS